MRFSQVLYQVLELLKPFSSADSYRKMLIKKKGLYFAFVDFKKPLD